MMNEEAAIAFLKEMDESYYRGETLEDDTTYDEFKKRAKEKWPNNPYFKTVGARIQNTPWKLSKHRIRMGSIENILVESANTHVTDCLANTRKWWEGLGSPEVLLQHKLDGLSVNLEYDYGMLSRAILRNDGIEGENIFFNVIRMRNVHRFLDERIQNVHGEIILPKENLVLINKILEQEGEKLYANSRNAAAGIARRQDGRFSEYLMLIPFEVVAEDGPADDFDIGLLEFLGKAGMHVIESFATESWDEIETFYKNILAIRDGLAYGIDGIVIKVNDLTQRLDTGERPLWIRAMKFPPEEKLFPVDEIRWYVGKTGKVTPVLHNEAGVQFNDKVVREVTLHNYNQFALHKIGKGDKVSVVISGDVIPKIENVVERRGGEIFLAPKTCPSCGSLLRIDDKFIYCDAEGCPGRIKALINAHIKDMGIEEVGPELVEKLYALGQAKQIVFNHFPDLYKLDKLDLIKVPGFGEKSIVNVLKNIQARKETTLAMIISSLGIPGIGEKVIEKTGAKDLDALMKLSVSQLSDMEGIGEITALALKEGLDKNYHLIGEMLANGVVIKSPQQVELKGNALQGKSYCFTGDVKVINPETQQPFTREECQLVVRQYGGEIKSGVSKKLDVLVLADMSSVSSKARKAREMGVTLISAEDFFNQLGLT